MLSIGAALLCAGCSEELGPVAKPVARVTGVVKEGDRTMAGGWIEFIPADGTIGDLRSAPIRPDGSFDADGVAIGTNAIRLVDVPVVSAAHLGLFTHPMIRWVGIVRQVPGDPRSGRGIEARFHMPFASPIRRRIQAGPSARLEIDVVDEARRYQEEWQRRLAGRPAEPGEGA